MATVTPKRPSALERAQTVKAKSEALAADQLTRKIRLEADEISHEVGMRKASEFEHHIYPFDAEVNDISVAECMRVMGLWVRHDPTKPIEIIFNSPGGSVFAGLALYDFIQQLRANGARVDTTALGYAASMGGVLLQAGEVRKMSANSYLMIHEVSSVGRGKMAEMEDEVKFVARLQQQLLAILASRSSMTAKQIKAKWKRKDWWLDAEESRDLGFCDEVE